MSAAALRSRCSPAIWAVPNDMARRLAKACGAVPVITTATDANDVFAVDEWAKHQHCLVAEPARIKKVSGALLAGRTVRFASDWPIQGTPPAGVEPAGDAAQASFALTITPTMTPNALHIIRVLLYWASAASGVHLPTSWRTHLLPFAPKRNWPRKALLPRPSIDLKKDELGLAEFGQKQGWPLPFIPPTNCAPRRGSSPIQTLCKASPAWITSASAPLCWPQAAPCGRTNGRGTV